MLCIRPLHKGVMPLPCGQCMPCRINKRRVWTTRLMLELYQHRKASFVTLTYSDEFLPPGNTVVKRHLQLFMKRLRKACEPVSIRFFGVGEYGDRTARAHYHVMLYGIDRDSAELVSDCWGMGHVHFGDVTKDSCQYIAGYVTKKLTKADDPRLKGREPEFSLMSRNPGIGAFAAAQLGAQMVRTSGAALWMAREGDVPKVTRMDGTMMPLGRYMVGKVRLAVGMENENSPEPKLEEYKEKMRALRDFVGPLAFKAGASVDWKKADSVILRNRNNGKFGKGVF